MSADKHPHPSHPGIATGRSLAILAAQLLGVSDGQVSLGTVQPLALVDASPPPLDAESTISALCLQVALAGEPLTLPGPPQGHFAATLLRTPCHFDGAFLGVPLLGVAGARLGALCVFDPGARAWSPQDIAMLEHIALAVVAEVTASNLRVQWQDNQVIAGLAINAAGIGTLDWDLLTQTVVCSEQLLALFEFAPVA